MSKDIIIQEGGVGKQLVIDKLRTGLSGGGTCLWVPEDATELGTKYITENGEFVASDDGYYGYSSVTVKGVNVAIGKDEDGDEAMASVDPTTERIMIQKLPAYIRVTTDPAKTSYSDGETIDFSGIVVKAYTSSGVELQTVPFGNLVFPVNVADTDQTEKTTVAESELVEGGIPCSTFVRCKQVNITPETIREQDPTVEDLLYDFYDGMFAVQHSESSTQFLAASATPGDGFTTQMTYVNMWGSERPLSPVRHEYTHSFTYGGKTVYYVGFGHVWRYDEVSLPNAPVLNKEAAWTMIYGTYTVEENTQVIPVMWGRPGDGKILEATFNIAVNGGDTP